MNFFQDIINLNWGSLFKAKIIIPDRSNIADNDIVDKQFVDTGDRLIVEEDPLNPGNPINNGNSYTDLGEIKIGDPVDGLSNQDLFQKIFVPEIFHQYQNPEVNLTGSFQDQTSNPLFEIEAGKTVTLELTVTGNIGDSPGVSGTTPYQFSGDEIIGTSAQSDQDFDPLTVDSSLNLTFIFGSGKSLINDQEYQYQWDVNVLFENPNPSNFPSNYNNPSPIDQFTQTVLAQFNVSGFWPWFSLWVDGNVPMPTTESELKSIVNGNSGVISNGSGKIIQARQEKITEDLSATGKNGTYFLIVPIGTGNAILDVVYLDGYGIFNAVQENIITNVFDFASGNLLNNYKIFRWESGGVFDQSHKLEINLNYT